MPARRQLAFAALADAVADARHLAAVGYARAGNWSLAQCCGHLANWIRYPLDGFPHLPAPMRFAGWVSRNTVGPSQKRQLLAGGGMKPGLPTVPGSVPAPGVAGDDAAVAEFERQVGRLAGFAGTPHPSPLFGPLTADELRRLSCLHAAHHLSFLIPNHAATSGSN